MIRRRRVATRSRRRRVPAQVESSDDEADDPNGGWAAQPREGGWAVQRPREALPDGQPPRPPLDPREIDVAQLMARGVTR